MSDKILAFPGQGDGFSVAPMATAIKACVDFYRQHDFRDVEYFEDELKRCVEGLESFRQSLIGSAQKLEAQVSSTTLDGFIDALAHSDRATLKTAALNEVSHVMRSLDLQVGLVNGQIGTLQAMSALDASREVEDLQGKIDRNASLIQESKQVSEETQNKIAEIEQAIESLKKTNLGSKFAEVAPPVTSLTELADPAAKLNLSIKAIDAVIQTIGKGLEVTADGLKLKSLYDDALTLRDTLSQETEKSFELNKKHRALNDQVEGLKQLPVFKGDIQTISAEASKLQKVLVRYQTNVRAALAQEPVAWSTIQKQAREMLAFERAILSEVFF